MKVKSQIKQQREMQDQWIIRIVLFSAGSFFLVVVFVMALHLPSDDTKTTTTAPWRSILSRQRNHNNNNNNKKQEQHRLAILLPFVGTTPGDVPPYLNLFCRGARAASDVADFFLIHNGVLGRSSSEEQTTTQHNLSFCHTNVIFVNLQSTKAMAERLLRVLDDKDESTWKIPRERLLSILTAHLNVYPYTLVEYKPAYGHLFQDLLQQDDSYYTHWAYSDLDMVFGDLGRHIEQTEWNDYDIVTYGFGDQQRLYVKGQFTMHKISENTNDLWKGCSYLVDMDKRFDKIMNHKGKFQLESAEGCYPSVLMQNTNISVKFAVKAWTDVSETDTAYSHGVYLYQNPKHRHKHVLAKQFTEDDADQSRLIHLTQDWFDKDPVYKDRKSPLQVPVGAVESLELPHRKEDDAHCMYWVQQKYQKHLCLTQHVSESENVFWVKGKLYKQAFRKEPLPFAKVDTAPFFHFQEWKRRYRANQLAPLDDPKAAISLLLPQGAVVLTHDTTKQPTISRTPPSSPLGIHCTDWTGIKDGNKTQLPCKTYCLSGEPDRNKLRVECAPVVSWENVQFASTAPAWNQVSSETDVTLVQTARVTARGPLQTKSVLQTIGANLVRWMGQPCVVLLYVSPNVVDPLHHVQTILKEEFRGFDMSATLFGVLSVPASEDDDEKNEVIPISQKALQNMAMDVVPTRWYMSGLDKGDTIVSPDTVQLARQKASVHQSLPGNLFYVPQFAFGSKEMTGAQLWNLDHLIETKDDHRLQMAEDYDPCLDEEDNEEEEDEEDALDQTTELWWEQTLELMGKKGPNTARSKLAEKLQELENMLLGNLVQGKEGSLSKRSSPLMLIDNNLRNNHRQHRLHVLAREVEEFGGDRCFNTLRLAQSILFGFKLNVLEGAFAASTPESRDLVFPPQDKDDDKSNECRACFMLDGANKLGRQILESETSRAVVARGLWAELEKQ